MSASHGSERNGLALPARGAAGWRSELVRWGGEPGCLVAERAQGLIGIAHPDFREELERQAYDQRLIPRGVTF